MTIFEARSYDLITRRFEFDAAHRVHGHQGKCRYLHGHRYRAEVSLWAPQLDAMGMVFDFGILKTLIGEWIDTNWDHNILLHAEDVLARICKTSGGIVWDNLKQTSTYEIFGDRYPFIMPSHAPNPTAENIARVLCEQSVVLLREYIETEESAEGLSLGIHNVRIYETPNCWADYHTLD